MKKKNVLNGILTGVLIVCGILFILSFAIIVPCFIRSFYINQIDSIHAVDELNSITSKHLGFESNKQTVIDAFNSVMDYIWKGIPFKNNPNVEGGFLTGALPLSANGEAHFHDCIFLFWLDMIIFLITFVILSVLLVLFLFKKFKPVKIFKLSPLFYSGAILVLFVLIVGIYGLIVGFDELFILFHKIAFPGKTNWNFSGVDDTVINILTEGFFLNCALYIGGVSIGLSLATMAHGITKRILEKKRNKKQKLEEQK